MTILNAHFDGTQIVLDDPVPADLRPNTKVRVVVETEAAPKRRPYHTQGRQMGLRPGLSLDNIGELLSQVEGEETR